MALRIVILLHFLKKYIYLIINPFKCFFFISVYVVYENALDDFNIYFIFFCLFIYLFFNPS